MSTPTDHLFTWTFSRKSLLIRYYLWLYEAREDTVNFCKLWWGMICSPITLPIRLVIASAVLVGRGTMGTARGIGWTYRWCGRTRFGLWWDQMSDTMQARERARVEARFAAKKARWFAFLDAMEDQTKADFYRRTYGEDSDHIFWNGIMAKHAQKEREATPATPSVPSRLMTAIANKADSVIAYFQAHPAIGQTINTATTWISKAFVRGVFYPLMVLIPITAFIFTGWEAYHHYNGLFLPFMGVWWLFRHIGHGGNVFLHFFVKVVLFTLAGTAAMAVIYGLMYLFLGGLMRIDYIMDQKYRASPAVSHGQTEQQPIRLDRLDNFFSNWLDRVESLDRDAKPKFTAADRFNYGWCRSKYTAKKVTTKTIAKPAYVVADKVAIPVGRGTKHSVIGVGRGFKQAGKFLVMGEHALKTRTCPRIRIVEDQHS